MARLIVLTGASGSGKTAIAEAIERRRPSIADVVRFDRIGVPSVEEMVAGWGSAEAWQRAMTFEWIGRRDAVRPTNRPVLFEGQMRLAFVQDALRSARIADARIVLVDCDDETRARRLRQDRGQPDLASSTMMDWAAALRREAHAGGHEVLDTSTMPVEATVERVCALLVERAGGDPAGLRP